MKKCNHFEKKLVACLHGELGDRESRMLDKHLEHCAKCRAELEVQRETLNVLGEALQAAPAPQELSPWRKLHRSSRESGSRLRRFWGSPQVASTLTAGALASILILISGSVVVFRIIPKKADPVVVTLSPESREVDRDELQIAVNKRDVPKPESAALDSRYGGEPADAQIMLGKAETMPVAETLSSAQLAELSDMPAPTVAPRMALKAPAVANGSVLYGAAQFEGFAATDVYYRRSGLMTDGSGARVGSEFNTEQYDWIPENAFRMAMDNPLSTFSIDVDRAAYANVRRFLNENRLPPPDAVRIEEMINYFEYDYPQPEGEDPFSINLEVAGCPWNEDHQLAMIGLQGIKVETADLPPNNLVFLLDVSGSMDQPDKLPLLQAAMRLLVDQLRPEDRVSIVVYAGAAGLVLEPTSDKGRIEEAISRLRAGGSTAGGAGIALAYETARKSFVENGNNRVILATDGDFNVGVSSDGELVRMIEEKRDSGIYLTVLGFGTGNLKDSKMEKLADKGNGNYAYIDDILEARKTLVNEMGGTLLTIAKDVKIQVEFNPAQVKAYRLVGYENRILANEDFDDDTKDAGELGAGHTVTALYELIPAGSDEEIPAADELKYQKAQLVDSEELMTVKLRYKQPDSDTSKLLVQSVSLDEYLTNRPSENFRFASEVAEFGLLLRDSQFKGSASYGQIVERARAAKGDDREGYRAEFIRLVEKARLLDRE
jgi:Ca-activated chloride channel family protein